MATMASSSSDSDSEVEEQMKPSKEFETEWIHAINKSTTNYRKPVKSGKWLVFEDESRIDGLWDTIRVATESGKLGNASKVSTMMDKDDFDPRSQCRCRCPCRGCKNVRFGGHYSPPEFVICIYTYDWTDEEDVMRVRQELRNLGIDKALPYKSDEDTAAGVYSHNTKKRISKYYC